ncbi:hypothetical protein JCM10207_007572, partial [Rhodosporidiobolus poonsookiae]
MAQHDYPIPDNVGNFHLVRTHELDAPPFTRIAKWESVKTGLKVVWADTPGPVSGLTIQVATETFDNSGLPHTLEHLLFTASKKHREPHFADRLASHMLGAGVDHSAGPDMTTFQASSASPEGLLALVPEYLSFLFFPKFTRKNFEEQVYSVDARGVEGGTVFSELEAQDGGQLGSMYEALSTTLYNERNGYRFDAIGHLDQIRNVTLEQVKAYHAKTYVPQNVTLIVTGHAIDPAVLLAIIDRSIEVDLAQAGRARGINPRGWVRPYVDSSTATNPPQLKQSLVKTVFYADADESHGAVYLSWVGPPVHDWLTIAALGVLWSYLTEGVEAPLNKLFMSGNDPACCQISVDFQVREPTVCFAIFSGVPAAHLPHLGTDILSALEHLLHEPLNLDRMRTCINKERLATLQEIEQSASDFVERSMAYDTLYGAEDGSDIKGMFGDLGKFARMDKFSASEWLSLLDKWFVKNPSLTIIGQPSAALALKQASAAAAAHAARAHTHLPSVKHLVDHVKALKAAQDARAQLERYPVPRVGDIGWIGIEVARSNGAGEGREMFQNRVQDKINKDGGGELPFFVQFNHFPSSFITVSAYLHGRATPILPFFISTPFQMPIKRQDGTVLPFETVERELRAITSSYECKVKDEGVLVSITVLKEHYPDAIEWLSDILFGMQFDVDRLKQVINSSLQTLHTDKQDAPGVAGAALDDAMYSTSSYKHLIGTVHCASLFPALRQRLQDSPAGVVKELEAQRAALLGDPQAWTMWVAGDVLGLSQPVRAWRERFHCDEVVRKGELRAFVQPREVMSRLGAPPGAKGHAILYVLPSTAPGTTKTTLVARAACPDATHPDFSAVVVAARYLAATGSAIAL